MSEKAKLAQQLYEEGYNCSQAALCVFADELGLDPQTARRLMEGFGGGMGDRTNICGALSGAVAVISYACSNGVPMRGPGRAAVYEKVGQATRAFKARYQETACCSILEQNPCGQKVYDAVKIAEQILRETKEG